MLIENIIFDSETLTMFNNRGVVFGKKKIETYGLDDVVLNKIGIFFRLINNSLMLILSYELFDKTFRYFPAQRCE